MSNVQKENSGESLTERLTNGAKYYMALGAAVATLAGCGGGGGGGALSAAYNPNTPITPPITTPVTIDKVADGKYTIGNNYRVAIATITKDTQGTDEAYIGRDGSQQLNPKTLESTLRLVMGQNFENIAQYDATGKKVQEELAKQDNSSKLTAIYNSLPQDVKDGYAKAGVGLPGQGTRYEIKDFEFVLVQYQPK